jgi:hypothetical protein
LEFAKSGLESAQLIAADRKAGKRREFDGSLD